MNELSQATLTQLANGHAVRDYTLHGQPGGYTLTVRYGMNEGVLVAKRGGPRLFAKIETAFDLLRSLRVAEVDVRITDYEAVPRPYRRGRPAAIAELDRLQGKSKTKKKAPAPPAERTIKPSVKAQIPLPGVVRGSKPRTTGQ